MPWNDRTKRRLKLRDLDILTALIDTGTMGKAASRLGISQPAVSKAIAELEAALGVRLVDRGRRGITPTRFGLALQKRSVAIFNDLRQSVQDIDFLSDPTKGEIRIGTTEPITAAAAHAHHRDLPARPATPAPRIAGAARNQDRYLMTLAPHQHPQRSTSLLLALRRQCRLRIGANIVRNERSKTLRSTAECARCSIRPQPRCFRLGKIEGAADAPRYIRA
jgi:DNA-binding transcriptional ArsR family regulator